MLSLLYWNISNSRDIHSIEKIKYNNVIFFKLILLFFLLLLHVCIRSNIFFSWNTLFVKNVKCTKVKLYRIPKTDYYPYYLYNIKTIHILI